MTLFRVGEAVVLQRLRFLVIASMAFAGFLSCVSESFAQDAPPPVRMRQLAPDVWVGLGGGGGNSTIVIGATGVIVVDAKGGAAAAKNLLAEVAKVTPKPVTTVIITHSDTDHAGGLLGFPPGVRVMAHQNAIAELRAAIDAKCPSAAPPERLPDRPVMGAEEVVDIDGVQVVLYRFAQAHTGGDLVVYFPRQQLVATGDIISGQRASDNPSIHFEKNGSITGWLTSVEGMLALNANLYVMGHGDDVVTKADVRRRYEATKERRARVEEMVRRGASRDAIQAALPDAPNVLSLGIDGGGGGPRCLTPELTGFVQIAFREVTGN